MLELLFAIATGAWLFGYILANQDTWHGKERVCALLGLIPASILVVGGIWFLVF